jgi:hypothetical protein
MNKAFAKLIDDYASDVLSDTDVITVLKKAPKEELSDLYYELLQAVGFAPCVEYITSEQKKLLDLMCDESVFPDEYWDEFNPFNNP